jgi:hypothetical protein
LPTRKTVAEKEAAIVDYLDREVRYTGIEFGEAAIVPHDPAETLSQEVRRLQRQGHAAGGDAARGGNSRVRGAAQR